MIHGTTQAALRRAAGATAAALALALAFAPPAARAQGQADDFERGKQMLAQGDAAGAAEVLGRVAESRKTDADVWYRLGLALTRTNRQKDARKAFERAVALQDSSPARTGLAFTLFLLGKTKDAEREVGRALALDPQSAQAHYVMGAVHFRNERMEEAMREGEEALRLYPDFPAAARLVGEALLNIYNDEFERAAGLYPMPPGVNTEAKSAAIEKRHEQVAPTQERMRAAAERLRRLANSAAAGGQKEGLTELAETLEVYASPPKNPPLAFRQSEVSEKAIILSKPEPGFTEEARRNLTTGQVRLRAVLAADGRVRFISVVRGLPDGLTEKCVEAARRIRFKPATLGGRRVSQYVLLEYNFAIGT